MVSISSFPKVDENKESIIFTFENVKTIYELKKNLSEKIKMPIGEIFIYNSVFYYYFLINLY